MKKLGGSALIVGAARNCATGLRDTIPRLNRFSESFDHVDYVIGTNDSSDETDEILRAWEKGASNIQIINLDHLAQNVPARTARLAVVRNICLSKIHRENYPTYDYFVVVDLDGVNVQLVDEPEFSEAIASAPAGWGGLFANQRTKYYDIWALRHKVWCPGDCWQDVKNASRGVFRRKSRRKAAVSRFVNERQKYISGDELPIEVESAFGGFGIYSVKAIIGAYYVGLTDGGSEVCEHVSFNAMVKNSGYLLYIIPSLLNDAPVLHL